MCHSEPCDWRWQGEGATKPVTESRGEEEGGSSGHWLWQCLPAHVFFNGWQVQRSVWRWSSPWLSNRQLWTCLQLEDLMNVHLLLEETEVCCLYEVAAAFWVTLPFVTVEGGTVVTVWALISYIFPCNGKQFSAWSHETLPTLWRKRGTLQAAGG